METVKVILDNSKSCTISNITAVISCITTIITMVITFFYVKYTKGILKANRESAEFAKEQLNISFVFGTAIASFICYTMFLGNFKSIEVISSFLVPVIILGIVILGISDYEGISKEFLPNYITSDINYKGNWLVSSILYASYNSLILIPILINLKKYNLSRFKVLMLGVATFFILGILMFFIYKVNAIFYPNIMLVELPNMMYASLLSSLIKNFYSVVIIAAIFTTAFSCGFSFLNMLNKKNYKRNALLLCIVSFFCSGIGFSNMINICFPIFGYLGIFQIVCLIYRKNRF